jgi:hypothetical protein
MKMMMRNSIIAGLILLLILSGCSGEELKDSDFRIDVKSNPDAALRTIFFLGDSIAFYEDSRPVVDTVKGRKFIHLWRLIFLLPIAMFNFLLTDIA